MKPTPTERPASEEGGTQRMAVIEERAHVGKERRETRVRVRPVEETVSRVVEAELTRRHVVVESVEKDELLRERPEPRREGDTFVFPVAEEVLVLETRWRLVEEVRVHATEDERIERVPVTLARRDVVVEREPSEQQGEDRS